MENHIEILDTSDDKKYFTQAPNIVFDCASAVEQALYLQMKRLSGKSGICQASEKYLRTQLGTKEDPEIGRKKKLLGKAIFKRAMEYLLYKGWIFFRGKEKIMTTGGLQWINTYVVTDIWVENTMYFSSKGGSKTNPPNAKKISSGGQEFTPLEDKGGSKSDSGCVKNEHPGGSKTDQEEYVFKKKEEGGSLQDENQNAENQKRIDELRKELTEKGVLSFPSGSVSRQKI